MRKFLLIFLSVTACFSLVMVLGEVVVSSMEISKDAYEDVRRIKDCSEAEPEVKQLIAESISDGWISYKEKAIFDAVHKRYRDRLNAIQIKKSLKDIKQEIRDVTYE